MIHDPKDLTAIARLCEECKVLRIENEKLKGELKGFLSGLVFYADKLPERVIESAKQRAKELE